MVMSMGYVAEGLYQRVRITPKGAEIHSFAGTSDLVTICKQAKESSRSGGTIDLVVKKKDNQPVIVSSYENGVQTAVETILHNLEVSEENQFHAYCESRRLLSMFRGFASLEKAG